VKKMLVLATLVALVTSACITMGRDSSPLIPKIQGMSLSSLEEVAPNITLSRWLSQLGGVSPTDLNWEVNDCGEGGDGRSAPTCVEGQVPFGSGRLAAVSVAVATTAGKTSGKPAIFMMYVRAGDKLEFASSTGELESLVAKWRK
jgi:hypothetical protein